jgi:hypothetical protein
LSPAPVFAYRLAQGPEQVEGLVEKAKAAKGRQSYGGQAGVADPDCNISKFKMAVIQN